MLIDLLSSNNIATYNVKIADRFGLHIAVYLSELISIKDKAQKKNKIVDGFFTVDRKYVTSRTTLTSKEQTSLDDILCGLGILERGEKSNKLNLNIDILVSMMKSEDECLIDKIRSFVNSKTKESNKITQRQKTANGLKSFIILPDEAPDELRQSYEAWIDSVYANPKGFLTPKSIELFQKGASDFSLAPNGLHDVDKEIALVNIATVGGYRDVQWAINDYNRNKPKLLKATTTNHIGVSNDNKF